MSNHIDGTRNSRAPARAALPRREVGRRTAADGSTRIIHLADGPPAPTDGAGARPAPRESAYRSGSWLEAALLLLLACYPLALLTTALLRGR